MSAHKNFDDFFKRCAENIFASNEMLVMAIALNETNYVDQTLFLYDFKNEKFSNTDYSNVVNKFHLFLDLVESKMPVSIDSASNDRVFINSPVLTKFFPSIYKTHEEYWSRLAINSCNKDIIKSLFEKGLFYESHYVICDDNIECFDNLFDMCTDNKDLMLVTLKSLYNGMVLVYEDENDRDTIMVSDDNFKNLIIEGLNLSRHLPELVRKIFLFCLLKNNDAITDTLFYHFENFVKDININIEKILDKMIINIVYDYPK